MTVTPSNYTNSFHDSRSEIPQGRLPLKKRRLMMRRAESPFQSMPQQAAAPAANMASWQSSSEAQASAAKKTRTQDIMNPYAGASTKAFLTSKGIVSSFASLKYGKPVDTVRSNSNEILVYQDINTGHTFTHVDRHTGKPSVMGTPDAVTVANYIFLYAYVDKQTLEFRKKGDTNAVNVQTYINKNTYVDRDTCIECAADAPNAVTRYEYNRLRQKRNSIKAATLHPDNAVVTLNVAPPACNQTVVEQNPSPYFNFGSGDINTASLPFHIAANNLPTQNLPAALGGFQTQTSVADSKLQEALAQLEYLSKFPYNEIAKR